MYSIAVRGLCAEKCIDCMLLFFESNSSKFCGHDLHIASDALIIIII